MILNFIRQKVILLLILESKQEILLLTYLNPSFMPGEQEYFLMVALCSI
jgi:hypothetical protein